MDLIEQIDGLKVPANFQPVSFAFHCNIGKILKHEEPNINTTEVMEPEIIDSNKIPFIP
jgi:hypothetical protein